MHLPAVFVVLALVGLSAAPRIAPAQVDPQPDQHAAWTALLRTHVRWQHEGHASTVDYVGLSGDRERLDAYLQALARIERRVFERWDRDRRQAFLINAYNAWTVRLILDHYPIASIKDIGGWFSSPWKQPLADLLGERRSLDDIEHRLLRGAPDFDEPRIHFAVNCASIGCPALRPEAYEAGRLDAQLADQTRRFLGDRSRNRYDAARGRLLVSKLFDWYADDFTAAGSALAPPLGFLARHAATISDDVEARRRLQDGTLAIGFLDYDWSLNDAAGDPTRPPDPTAAP